MVEPSPPDILLLDIGMPLLDGFGVVRKLRQNPRFTSLPVVAVTAYAMQRDRERIMDSQELYRLLAQACYALKSFQERFMHGQRA